MSEHLFCTRVWQLRRGASPTELENLACSGILEMMRWVPGVKHLSLSRVGGDPQRYVMQITFTDAAAYAYWRQIEQEAADYWEHLAAVLMQWEQLCELVEEYAGELVINQGLMQ